MNKRKQFLFVQSPDSRLGMGTTASSASLNLPLKKTDCKHDMIHFIPSVLGIGPNNLYQTALQMTLNSFLIDTVNQQ